MNLLFYIRNLIKYWYGLPLVFLRKTTWNLTIKSQGKPGKVREFAVKLSVGTLYTNILLRH